MFCSESALCMTIGWEGRAGQGAGMVWVDVTGPTVSGLEGMPLLHGITRFTHHVLPVLHLRWTTLPREIDLRERARGRVGRKRGREGEEGRRRERWSERERGG